MIRELKATEIQEVSGGVAGITIGGHDVPDKNKIYRPYSIINQQLGGFGHSFGSVSFDDKKKKKEEDKKDKKKDQDKVDTFTERMCDSGHLKSFEGNVALKVGGGVISGEVSGEMKIECNN